MQIPLSSWYSYITKLSAINREASRLMQEYGLAHGYEDGDAIVQYAYALATKYGDAAAALACEMYDSIAEAQGATVPAAEPAPTATYDETAKAVYGTMKNKQNTVPATVGRLVKMAGADTMLQNARRDGAQFAWVPMGDTCAFCMTLASRGWQYQSKKAMKNGHAEHIHSNCDCEYCVRFDGKSTVAGYDPEALQEKYYSFDGTPDEKINAWRREIREQNKDLVNEQKRIAYADKPNVPREKFTKYALDPAADPNKAKAFQQALGYTKDNCDGLINQIRALSSIDKCREKGHNEYGTLYEQIMEISGVNGKTANVCTGWIKKDGEQRLTLTSAYVTKKKVNQND